MFILASRLAHSSTPSTREHTSFQEVSDGCTKTKREHRWERGRGMRSDSGKDNENGKKIKGLEIPESEMTAYYCHCSYPYCWFRMWLNAVWHCFGWLPYYTPITIQWKLMPSHWVYLFGYGEFFLSSSGICFNHNNTHRLMLIYGVITSSISFQHKECTGTNATIYQL